MAGQRNKNAFKFLLILLTGPAKVRFLGSLPTSRF